MATAKVVKKTVEKKPVTEKQATSKLSIAVYDKAGKKTDTFILPKEIFDKKVSDQSLAQYVHVYQSNQHQGTRSTKTRSEVKSSTKKIYRQKGTGRARHGARTAPIFVGGGVAFGTKPKTASKKLSKKQRQLAFVGALTSRVEEGNVIAISGLDKLSPKTKDAVAIFKAMPLTGRSRLFVHEGNTKNIVLSMRNIEAIDLRNVNQLNAFDLLHHDNVIFAKEALLKVVERVKN